MAHWQSGKLTRTGGPAPAKASPVLPVYKRRWFLVISGVFLLLCIGTIANLTGKQPKPSVHTASSASVAEQRTKSLKKRSTLNSGSTAIRVNRAQLGAEWPFKGIYSGIISCDPQHPGAILFTLTDGSGRTYGLNGTALDAGYPQFPRNIWPRDGTTSISPLQDRAPDSGCAD